MNTNEVKDKAKHEYTSTNTFIFAAMNFIVAALSDKYDILTLKFLVILLGTVFIASPLFSMLGYFVRAVVFPKILAFTLNKKEEIAIKVARIFSFAIFPAIDILIIYLVTSNLILVQI